MSKAKLACKCKSISDSVLGDGCDICNPEKAKDVAYERITDLEQQLAEMRREYDSLIDENISVTERNLILTSKLTALKEQDNE